MVLPVEGHNFIECFVDQVKLTHALVQDLDEVVEEVNLLEEHGEEASQKIIELEALCKKLREDAKTLMEENTKLEGMVESHDELIKEFVDKYGYNRNNEDTDNEDEDDDDGEDDTKPPAAVPPLSLCHLLLPPR
jgi:hypothetical protein